MNQHIELESNAATAPHREAESGKIKVKFLWKTSLILSIVLTIVGTIILNLILNG